MIKTVKNQLFKEFIHPYIVLKNTYFIVQYTASYSVLFMLNFVTVLNKLLETNLHVFRFSHIMAESSGFSGITNPILKVRLIAFTFWYYAKLNAINVGAF